MTAIYAGIGLLVLSGFYHFGGLMLGLDFDKYGGYGIALGKAGLTVAAIGIVVVLFRV